MKCYWMAGSVFVLANFALVPAYCFFGQAKDGSDSRFLYGELGKVKYAYALAFSADSKSLLSVCSDSENKGKNMVLLWDVVNRKVVKRFDIGGYGDHIAIAPSGKAFAVTNNCQIKVYSIAGELLNEYRHFENFLSDIEKLEFIDEHNTMSVCTNGVATKWNYVNNRTNTWMLHHGIVFGVNWNRNFKDFSWIGGAFIETLKDDLKNPGKHILIKKGKFEDFNG